MHPLQPLRVTAKIDDLTENGETNQPLSPYARILSNPGTAIDIIAKVGFKTKVNTHTVIENIANTFLAHPRFSSVLVTDETGKDGNLRWVRTELDLDKHVIVPKLNQNDIESPEKYVEDYIYNLTQTALDRSIPLWDLHILNLKTSDAESVVVFRVNHSLGDGISLISWLLACTRNVSDPEKLPTLPSKTKVNSTGVFWKHWFKFCLSMISLIWNTIDGVVTLLATLLNLSKDTQTPLKGSEVVSPTTPRRIVHKILSLDDVKLVKNAMNTTVNDVLLGVTEASLTRYLNRRYGEYKNDNGESKGENNNLPPNICLRVLHVVNNRASPGIQELADMMKKGSRARWGNQVGYVILPLTIALRKNPLDYVWDAKAIMDRKKASLEASFAFFLAKYLPKFFGTKVIREKMKRGRSLNVDVTRQPNSEEMGSREASNSPVTPMGSTESSKNGGNANKKTKRGPTRMGIIKDKFQRLEVEWNEKGQPIGFNSISFASFLGATIRENVPITTKSWEDKKEDLWTLITQRFHIEDYHRNYVMQAMGNYLRQSRSDTSKLVREAAKKSEGKERVIAMCRPANVSNDKEWNDWVKYILSPEFESKSKKFKEIRAKHKLDHTTGRQGCARLEQSMIENSETPEDVKRWCVYTKAHTRKNGEPVNTATKEVLDQMAAYVEENQSATQSELITEDPVTKVLGPERRGRVRGLGFGATPSKLNAVIAANGRVRELEKKLDTQDYKVQILEKKVSKVDQLEDNLRKLSELYSKQNQQTESRIVDDMTRSGKCGETNGGNNSNMPKENVRCELLHWYNYDIDEVVAEGTIASTDPKTKIHHMPLGRDCWKVWVDSVIEPNISLYRPTSEAHILNEALGSTVAWPKSSIKLLE